MNKSIVTFTRGTLAQATPLWQYDYGQVLEINGLELPTTYQVHFCNCSDTQTITVLGNADGVLIPDNLLQTGKTVIAYIYLHTGADDGETEYKITIPIRTRPAPSDIPPTPEQQSALDEAIAALNSAVDTVEDIADGIPDQINTALEEAKESGEFDGPPGPKGDAYVLTAADREEIAGIASDDVLVVSDEEPTGEPLPKIWIDSDDDSTILIPTMEDIGDLDDLVTTAKDNLVAAINEAAQSGGGGGTGDYDDLTNQPQINGTTLSGNKTAAQLGLSPAGAYVKPSGGIPASDLASAVQTSLGKADTALQTAPVTSVNGQTGAVSLSIPSTASEVGAVAANQGAANANKVLTVNSSGVVVPEDNRFVVTLTPTAQDFSGVMDKTCAEITAAYEAGKDIWLEVDATASGYELWRVKATIEAKVNGENYGQVMAFLINLQLAQPSIIFIFTNFNTSGDSNRYLTQIFPLATGQWTGGSF